MLANTGQLTTYHVGATKDYDFRSREGPGEDQEVPAPRASSCQTLIVTAGCGWAQRWGGPIEEIRPGDVIWFPPGEKHWHGATPTTAMTHIAIQEKKDGKGGRLDGACHRRTIPRRETAA
jgi:mannose-6-phosphate isomerase-like protein (cupin superfamily)